MSTILMTQANWPIAFFDDDYLKIYRPQFKPERTAAETRFIAESLALSAAGEVLDLACGFGRHAIGMAALGYRVTGVDFNPRYLDIARADAATAGVTVTWRTADMRSLGIEHAFDGVYSFFTSFGYFEDDRDDARIVRNLRASLKPGASLVMDLASKERIAKVLQPTVSQRAPDGTLRVQRHEVTDDWTRVQNEWLFIKDGLVKTFRFSLRVYSGQELKQLVEAAGFREIRLYGALDGRPYDGAAERLVVVAVR